MLLPLLAACEIEKVSIPRPESRLAMHAVLSASAESQVVLLERTRNGSVYIFSPSFDLEDPIGSDVGIAEGRATVTLTTPNGQTLVAREDDDGRLNSAGRGVYRFPIGGASLVRGGTYRLSVRTAKGELLGAETVVPGGTAVQFADSTTFDRERDTMRLEWPAAPGARSYFVRIETPYGPRAFFTDSTRVRLPGDLRNPEVDGLPRVFIPGFPQAVTVSAVDSNYYDWYRTHDDALAGTGLVSRVEGGLGVFGALVRLHFDAVQVVAPQVTRPAGRYRFVGTDTELHTTPFLGLDLYIEARAARGDQSDALSGSYDVRPRFGYQGCLVCGLFGSVKNGRVELSFLQDWSARDTTELLTGEIHGDTIVGRYRGFGGVARFVRQP